MSSVSTSTSSVTTPGRAAGSTPKTLVRGRATRRLDRSIGTQWACLVVAADTRRRDALERSAREAGWTPILCETAKSAGEQIARWRTQLAAIDLAGASPQIRAALQDLAKSAAMPDRLLAIVDDGTDAEAELWARQAGAWVYLPAPDLGVDPSADKPADLTEVFAEARAAAEKLTVSEPAVG